MIHQLLPVPSLFFCTFEKTKNGNSNYLPSFVFEKVQKGQEGT